jgi:hypothetical protein
MRGGERLAPDIGQSSVNGAAMRSLYAAPLPCEGEGEDAEGGLLPRGLRALIEMKEGGRLGIIAPMITTAQPVSHGIKSPAGANDCEVKTGHDERSATSRESHERHQEHRTTDTGRQSREPRPGRERSGSGGVREASPGSIVSVGEIELLLVDRIASTAWRLRRLLKVETLLYARGHA